MVRRVFQSEPERLLRQIEPALRGKDGSQVEIVSSDVRGNFHGHAEMGLRVVPAVLFLVRLSQIRDEDRIARVFRQCGLERPERLLEPSRLETNRPEGGQGAERPGFKYQCGIALGAGFFKAARSVEGPGEVDVGVGGVGRRRDDAPGERFGFGVASQFVQRVADIDTRLRIVGIVLENGSQVVDRLAPPAESEVGGGPVGEHVRRGRLGEPDRLADLLDGRFLVAVEMVGQALQVPSVGVRRVLFEEGDTGGFGLVEGAASDVGENRVKRIDEHRHGLYVGQRSLGSENRVQSAAAAAGSNRSARWWGGKHSAGSVAASS